MEQEESTAVSLSELVIFTPVATNGQELETTPTNIQNNELVNFSNVVPVTVKGLEKSNANLYVCGKCNRTFKQKIRYERHVTNHPSEKHYLCTICQKTFTRMSHLEKHKRTHSDERRHVCETCGAAFILPHHLVRHMLIHTGHRPFDCGVCHKQFTRKAGLTQHMYVHNGVRPYSCQLDDCGKQFTDRTTLRRHLLTHSREKPFICKVCDKTYRTKSTCRKHYLRHFKGDQSFKCGICEEMFKSEKELKTHNFIHEPKQKAGVFRCGFCLRVFKSKDDLDSHVPLHESGTRYACSQCSVKFYTESDLVNHMSRHIDQTFTEDEATNKVVLPLETIERTVFPTTVTCDTSSPSKLPQPCQSHSAQMQQSVESGKVLVVLQIPNNSHVKNGSFELQSIQQLIENAQVDKLLVTTDKVNDMSAFSFSLSQNQQQGIQQILQTTNIYPIHSPKKKTSESNTSTFIQVSLPVTENVCSLSFSESVSRKLGESVFTSPERETIIGALKQAVDSSSVSLNSTDYGSLQSSISPNVLKGYQLYESREDYHSAKLGENVSATETEKSFDGRFRDKQLETKTLFSGEFPLCDTNILGEDVPHFSIVSTS